VVVNIVGDNENVWVRRATLAHELGHLLWDPEQDLRRLKVDSYQELNRLYRDQFFEQRPDHVERRANAFAIELLAPHDRVRDIFVRASTEREGLRGVMEHFGISYMAARYHIWNAMDRTIDLESLTGVDNQPTDEWKGRESFANEYFRPESVPISRRGHFAGGVVRAERARLISLDTAALYLRCTPSEYEAHRKDILELYP
jgi:Zn-dependent peptidase ImmA (M78 family)